MNKRSSFVYLALITLVASGLACNAPTPTETATQSPPPASPGQETPSPPPTHVPPEATPTELPEATNVTTVTVSPAATTQPTATITSAPTETPTPQPSAGPLDFDPPAWIHSWEPLSNDQYKVVVIVNIRGGAPPFTIEHDHVATENSPTSRRDYNLTILTGGCGAIVHNITVASADGQKVSKDYWIGVEAQPWCND